MHTLARLVLLPGICLSVSACAPMLTALGTNATVVQAVATMERVKLAGDVTSFASSQKTLTDHAVSLATGKDCKVFNVLTKDAVCSDSKPAARTDVARAQEATQVAAQDKDHDAPDAMRSNIVPVVRIDSLIAMPAGSAQSVATSPAMNVQDGFVAVAGTNLRRRLDASLAAPDSETRAEPHNSAQPVPAPELSRESASGD